jgi:hypothetical protein
MNLTPDQNTGIGIWTEEMFVKAIRTGKHMGTDTSRDPAADAVAGVSPDDRCRPEGDLRVPQDDSAGDESRSGSSRARRYQRNSQIRHRYQQAIER